VDTLVKLGEFRVSLLQCVPHTYTMPPLTLYAWVDANLLRAAGCSVLRSARFEYWGDAVSLVDCGGAAGGERLALGLARAQRSLAEQLSQSFFLAQAPTAMTWPHCVNQSWKGK